MATQKYTSGFTISSAGDFNNDGFDDIIVGTTYYVDYCGWGFKAYLIFGNNSEYNQNILLESIASSKGIKFTPTCSNNVYSSLINVNTIRDVNSDGFDDIIIGDIEYSGNQGITFVIYGNKTYQGSKNILSLSLSQMDSYIGINSNDYTGTLVAPAGDLNNDGVPDLLIGSYRPNSKAGSVYVLYGGKNMQGFRLNALTLSTGFTFNGVTSGDYVGFSACGEYDVNGDGIDDLVVGAPKTSSSTGKVYVIYGKKGGNPNLITSLTSSQGFSITGNSGSSTGWSVALGDFNGDGFGDTLIGSPDDYSYAGAGYVVFGYPAPTVNPTKAPTPSPSISPTFSPSTQVPSFAPTEVPTIEPSFEPSLKPTYIPTFSPTGPTSVPTAVPSHPTAFPSISPTFSPTHIPSIAPTEAPTLTPTILPSQLPTFNPTLQPTTSSPTFSPSITPTLIPSYTPTYLPTMIPTAAPTRYFTIYCITGENICTGTPGNDNFQIFSSSDIEVIGNGGSNLFVIYPSQTKNEITINDFDYNLDLLDLSQFTNMHYSDVRQVYLPSIGSNGALQLTLPDAQIILLMNIVYSISESNFIGLTPKKTSKSLKSTVIVPVVSAITPAIVVGIIATSSQNICYYIFDNWGTTSDNYGMFGKLLFYPCSWKYKDSHTKYIASEAHVSGSRQVVPDSTAPYEPIPVVQVNQGGIPLYSTRLEKPLPVARILCIDAFYDPLYTNIIHQNLLLMHTQISTSMIQDIYEGLIYFVNILPFSFNNSNSLLFLSLLLNIRSIIEYYPIWKIVLQSFFSFLNIQIIDITFQNQFMMLLHLFTGLICVGYVSQQKKSLIWLLATLSSISFAIKLLLYHSYENKDDILGNISIILPFLVYCFPPLLNYMSFKLIASNSRSSIFTFDRHNWWLKLLLASYECIERVYLSQTKEYLTWTFIDSSLLFVLIITILIFRTISYDFNKPIDILKHILTLFLVFKILIGFVVCCLIYFLSF